MEDRDLVTKALEHLEKREWPIRLLDRIIPHVSFEELLPAMQIFFISIDPTQDEKSIALSFLAKAADRYGGSTILVALHHISEVPLRRMVEYIQLALTLLKPDAIAAALTTMVSSDDGTTLPPMLMRTLIQSVTLHRPLTGLVVGLLARLVGKEIWRDQPKLWEGFIRCVKTLGSSAHAAMIQLPPEQLGQVLVAIPEMRDAFLIYLKQQSATMQSKYSAIISSE